MYKLHLRYIYTFYSFGDLIDSQVCEDVIEVDCNKRFTLYQEEDSSFILSELYENAGGVYVVVTHPNKDRVVVRAGETAELVYDEYFNSMGDDNHNVYEGALTLEKIC